MSRKAGTPKTGGRKAGTPNKVTGALREFVVSLLDENRERVARDLKNVSAKDRLQIFERLLSYVIPRRAENEVQFGFDASKIEIELVDGGREPYHSEDEIDLEREQ